MRSIKKRIALWHIVLIIGIAAIAIPVAARVSSGPATAVDDGRVFPEQRTGLVNENAAAKNSGKSSTAGKYRGNRAAGTVTSGGRRPQDYYDRRREYWEKRVDRRLQEADESEDDEEDAKDSKDKKDSKADKDDEDDEVDKETQDREEFYERRREHWRRTLDEDW